MDQRGKSLCRRRLHQPSPTARRARGFGWQAASLPSAMRRLSRRSGNAAKADLRTRPSLDVTATNRRRIAPATQSRQERVDRWGTSCSGVSIHAPLQLIATPEPECSNAQPWPKPSRCVTGSDTE